MNAVVVTPLENAITIIASKAKEDVLFVGISTAFSLLKDHTADEIKVVLKTIMIQKGFDSLYYNNERGLLTISKQTKPELKARQGELNSIAFEMFLRGIATYKPVEFSLEEIPAENEAEATKPTAAQLLGF